MFKNVALGIIAASALAFAGSQVWVAYIYKKAMNGLFDSDTTVPDGFDPTDVDWEDLYESIENMKKEFEDFE